MVLKQVYCKVNEDTKAEIEYFISCVVTIPVSEVIVKFWGSVIDKIVRDKVVDVTVKFLFTKLVGPSAWAISDR